MDSLSKMDLVSAIDYWTHESDGITVGMPVELVQELRERLLDDTQRAALAELVALKDMKDRLDAGPVDTDAMIEYAQRKPAAWAAARKALS